MEWVEVKKAFFEVLEAEPPERAGRLRDLAERDPELHRRVESLLRWNDQASSFLDDPALADLAGLGQAGGVAAPPDVADAGAELAENEEVGPYRVIRVAGRGGMGVVYEARQEAPVRRRVALKLIKWGLATDEVMARFETERQALALMNHPNIASVHDAGADADGRPYFVMEYVSGAPITDYCDLRRLDVRRRLELFRQLCGGVQHAHQKGVIHRDIKPSNVLVAEIDGVPVPKIIDFGVAKATQQRLTEGTIYTRLGQLIGTPEYMSPEQAEMTNADIDTRTDVYSLGAVLYELLAGVQPFDPEELRAAGFDELRRRIREVDPPPPSTRLSDLGAGAARLAERRRHDTGSLSAMLRGDLDWIVMKALAKNRDRRYASAAELSEDVERYLAHEPVLAGPPTTAYRLRKFVRRHRFGVAVALLLLVATVAAVTGTAVGLVRATRAERHAVREAAKAKAIHEFLQETLGSGNPDEGLGRDTTVLEALAAAIGKVEDKFSGQPEIEASVRMTVGMTYRALGRYEEALEQVEQALRMRRSMLGEHPDVAESYQELGTVLTWMGRYDEAEPHFRQTIEMLHELSGPESEPLAEALSNLGVLLFSKGDYPGAESRIRESLRMSRRLFGDEHEEVALLTSNLGAVLQTMERFEEAEPLYRESLAISRKVLRDDHPNLATAINNLAWFYDMQGDHAAAEPYYAEAVAVFERALGPRHWRLAATRTNYAKSLIDMGRYADAEPVLLAAYEVRKVNSDPGGLERTLGGLVDLYQGWGRPEEAEKYRAELAELDPQG